MSVNSYESTEPKFWLAWSAPGSAITNQQYSYITPGHQIGTGHENLEVFDTEAELAARVDELKGIPGWYYLPENRIPESQRPS